MPPEQKAVIDPKTEERARKEAAFVHHMAELSKSSLSQLDKDIEKVRLDLAAALAEGAALEGAPRTRKVTRELGIRRSAATRLQGRLQGLLATRDPVSSNMLHISALYQAMLDVPRVLDVFVIWPRLVIVTDVLYGLDKRREWRRIGPFEASFDLITPQQQTFTWKNLDGAQSDTHGSKWHAPPNIRDTSSGVGNSSCMGTQASELITRAMSEKDYLSLVQLAVRFPECMGTEDNTVIEFWPTVPLKHVPEWYRVTFPT